MKKQLLFLNLFLTGMFSWSQTVVFNSNFDNLTVPALPTEWLALTNGNVGFRSDSTNTSGNNGASGLNNLVIRNDENVNGTYELITESFDCTPYSGLSVMWSSRVSNNFLASGSELPSFWYSLDNGVSWEGLNFLDNIANSIWSEVNAGSLITLPTIADNQASIRFKWIINIVGDGATTSGTYRIDDFRIYANQGVSVQESALEWMAYPNPCADFLTIESGDDFSNVMVFDPMGRVRKVDWNRSGNFWTADVRDWASGIYSILSPYKKETGVIRVIHL
jgi:hypothetical protein